MEIVLYIVILFFLIVIPVETRAGAVKHVIKDAGAVVHANVAAGIHVGKDVVHVGKHMAGDGKTVLKKTF
jgi:hypothetical protein